MALPGRLYLDTNIFIYAFEGSAEPAALLRQLLLSPQRDGRPQLVTSEFTLAEALVHPYRRSDAARIELYENWTASNAYVEVGPVDRAVLRGAAALRADHAALKLPDAIHIATAILGGCPYLLTADGQLSDAYAFVQKGSAGVSTASSTTSIVRPDREMLEGWLA